jgi:copper chaperone CopZ
MNITGMDCGHCAQRLGQSLERLDGVIRAKVDPVGTAAVRYDEATVSLQEEATVSLQELEEGVRAAGFDVA